MSTEIQDSNSELAERPTVYWRPGCGFCMHLRSGLKRYEIEANWVDIWEDPEAAATVRSLANGNEVVPTVTYKDTFFVNPSAGDVAAAMGIEKRSRGWFR